MSRKGGVFLILLGSLLAVRAGADAPQLQGVRTVVDQRGTTLLLRLPPKVTYTLSEVGPRVFMLDVTGATSTRPAQREPVASPLVQSYRLLNYDAPDHQPHLALEITLREEADVKAMAIEDGLQVTVQKHASAASSTSASSISASKPAAATSAVVPSASAIAPAKAESASGSAILKEVSVVQPESASGLEVQVVGNRTLDYHTMELNNPDRLVLDLTNTIDQIHQKNLAVNTPPLRDVRIGQFSMRPAVSRVVLDLNSKTHYEVRRESNSLVIVLDNKRRADNASAAQPAAALAQNSDAVVAANPVLIATTNRKAAPRRSVDESAASGVFSSAAAQPALPAAQDGQVLLASLLPMAPAGLTSNDLKELNSAVTSPAPALVPVSTSLNSALDSASMSETGGIASGMPRAAELLASAAAAPVAATGISPAAAKVDGAAKASGPSAVSGATQGEVLLAQPNAAPTLMAQAGSSPASTTMSAQAVNPIYTGEPISLDLKDVDLKDFFRLIHEISGLNVVLDPNVSGTLTIVLDEVPWDQALDIVLKNNGLGKQVEGNVVRIARLSTLESEERQRKDLATAVEQGQPKVTATRTLSYAKAADLLPTLKRFLSSRGDLVADARTNTLIITDIPSVISIIDNLLGTLDRKTRQVEIEARVVSASRSFSQDIGSQFALAATSGNVILGGAGEVGPSPIERTVGSVPLTSSVTSTTATPVGTGFGASNVASIAAPLSTNFPAVGATSGISALLTAKNLAIDSIITAAESKGIGKLLSRPKVITQNNVEASVKQGVRIPIQTDINNTISVQFIDVVLRLTVTPQITAEGTIFLKTDVQNDTIDPGIARINGVPAVDTQEATTSVLVDNGGTVFFGGVIQTQNNLTEQEVPLLGSVPLIGNLFRRKAVSTSTNELLFFITPKIVI